MAGRRRQAQEVVVPSRALVASAVRYSGEVTRIYSPLQEWQKEAYRHYSICGEARFAAQYYGHALSRCFLEAVEDGPKGPQVLTTGVAPVALKELFNGPEGQSQMLAAIGVHLTIGGECYLVGRTVVNEETETKGDVWEVYSALEVVATGKRWTIRQGDGRGDIPLGKDDVVIRIWRPLPGNRLLADSPFRSLLPVLTEIEWLTKHIFAQATSRLASAGILFMPDSMTFPDPPEREGQAEPVNDADAFMQVFASVVEKSLADEGSMAAKVPIVVTAPEDSIDKARLMHFWSDLDKESQGMRSGAITRFALGMDLPAEQVLGMASNPGTGGGNSNGVSHWGAWQIEEATIKMHIEPMLELICSALTVGYLRIQTDGDERLRANTTNLRLRPDRSKEALELYDRGLLSEAALLREVGFDEKDGLDDDDKKQWLIRKIASGSATPDQVGAALRLLGVDLPVETPPQGPPPEAPRESRPDPSLEEHPVRPSTPEQTALLAASNALVFRALERAGNRLRSSVGQPETPCRAFEVHTVIRANGTAQRMLVDAFDSAEQVLDGLADHVKVVPVLESYCTALMGEQSPHERERLEEWMRLGGVLA